MLINHMGFIIKAQIKITQSKSLKLTKKIRNFYLKKKENEDALEIPKEFSGDLAGKMEYMVVWSVPVGE